MSDGNARTNTSIPGRSRKSHEGSPQNRPLVQMGDNSGAEKEPGKSKNLANFDSCTEGGNAIRKPSGGLGQLRSPQAEMMLSATWSTTV